MKRLSQRQFAGERRKAERYFLPGLVAYYWDGGVPAAHGVRAISITGMYLFTEQRWYLGTVLIMTLQKKNSNLPEPERSIAVQARVVRCGTDGVGFAFASPEAPQSSDQSAAVGHNAADRETLDRFLRRLFEAGRSQT